MKDRLTILTACLIAMVLLAGCKGGGSGSTGFFGIGGSSGGGESVVASLPDDGGSGDSGVIGYSPEPATLALLGSGLFAYALLRRRKKKK